MVLTLPLTLFQPAGPGECEECDLGRTKDMMEAQSERWGGTIIGSLISEADTRDEVYLSRIPF